MVKDMSQLSKSAGKVQAALREMGVELVVTELPGSTRTAAEAAQAIGCQVGQIAKSIVFQAASSGRPVLVVASGSNRVNEVSLAGRIGENIKKADPEFVLQHTGFVIGGVPPVGHSERIETFIDQDLLQYKEIWAAAGNPHAVFRLTPDVLVRMTGGVVLKVSG
jgi:prolyl-tRNA editing enzyme YbaK/EbsC (Cys-tRNA(Pro) deacylase)